MMQEQTVIKEDGRRMEKKTKETIGSGEWRAGSRKRRARGGETMEGAVRGGNRASGGRWRR